MRIAIVGTRGIPNLYGGFEQNAENLGPRFAKAGHEVVVYCASYHPDKTPRWHGVEREFVPYPEKNLGPLGTMLYDRTSILRAVQSRADVVLALGYTPASMFFGPLRRASIPVVTNMDGLEWKRSKWNALARRFIRWNERLGVTRSDALIADHPEIREYLRRVYGAESTYIGYGTEHVTGYDDAALSEHGLQKGEFDLTIARMEPENNVETIVRGHAASGSETPLLVVGGINTPLAKKLETEFRAHPRVRFVGAIYNVEKLNALRRSARYYIHGHSVGGTNPSLLEAMAAGATIWIHENPFNRYVVGPHAVGFTSADDLAQKLRSPPKVDQAAYLAGAKERMRDEYSWEKVAERYLDVLAHAAQR